jgi:hypothetical protein
MKYQHYIQVSVYFDPDRVLFPSPIFPAPDFRRGRSDVQTSLTADYSSPSKLPAAHARRVGHSQKQALNFLHPSMNEIYLCNSEAVTLR